MPSSLHKCQEWDPCPNVAMHVKLAWPDVDFWYGASSIHYRIISCLQMIMSILHSYSCIQAFPCLNIYMGRPGIRGITTATCSPSNSQWHYLLPSLLAILSSTVILSKVCQWLCDRFSSENPPPGLLQLSRLLYWPQLSFKNYSSWLLWDWLIGIGSRADSCFRYWYNFLVFHKEGKLSEEVNMLIHNWASPNVVLVTLCS